MNNEKRKGIYARIDHLSAMAGLHNPDLEELLIEIAGIDNDLAKLNDEIKIYTPNESSYNETRSKYQVSLTARMAELSENEELLNNIISDITLKEEELKKLENLEKETQDDLTNEETYIENMKSYPVSRKLKGLINESEDKVLKLKNSLEMITTSKIRCQNAIDVLNSQKEAYETKINALKDEIDSIEYTLSSNKTLEDTGLIQEKKRILKAKNKEKEELLAKRKLIEENPVYIAYQIKDKIDKQASYESILELVNILSEKALKQPYMSKVIRNGQTDELKALFNSKKDEYSKMKKEIAHTDYSLKKLPSEESRLQTLDSLTKLSDNQIEHLEQLVKNYDNEINELTNVVSELEISYNTNLKNIQEYEDGIALCKDTKEVARKKKEYQKMQKMLANDLEIIKQYKSNIISLISERNMADKKITEIKANQKQYQKEVTIITKRQISRNNYKDVIRENNDKEQLEALGIDIEYLANRLKYQNYNVAQLKTEIIATLKTLYPEASKKEKKDKEPKEIKGIALGELLHKETPVEKEIENNDEKDEDKVITPIIFDKPTKELIRDEQPIVSEAKEEITQEEIANTVKDFVDTLNHFYPQAKQDKDEKSSLDLEKIVKSEKRKHKPQVGPIIPSFNLKETLDEGQKMKTIAVDDIEKKEENPIYKVVSIIPLINNLKKNNPYDVTLTPSEDDKLVRVR